MSQSAVKFVPTNSDKEQFFATLRQRVQAYFTQNNISRNANGKMYLKTVIMLSLYIVPFVSIYLFHLSFGMLMLCYAVMGLGVVGIGMGIMHDAIHNSYSNNNWINRVLGYSLNLVGGSDFTWKVQHNHFHHTYTNVYGLDEDIHDKPILRLAPTGKWSPIHRYQHIYAIFLYGLATVSWIINKDFRQLRNYNRTGLTAELGHSPSWEMFKLVTNKILYYIFTILVPMFVLGYVWWQILVGLLLTHFIAGLTMTVIFQLAHVVEETEYPVADANGNIDNAWAIHQMETTADFARSNWFLSWWAGGLNFQVEHHLFPYICHVHYPKIAPIVKQTAQEFGVPYHDFDSTWVAIKSHFGRLKELGAHADAA